MIGISRRNLLTVGALAGAASLGLPPDANRRQRRAEGAISNFRLDAWAMLRKKVIVYKHLEHWGVVGDEVVVV